MYFLIVQNGLAGLNSLSARAGDCICREGYAGPRCDQCAKGYQGYPTCTPCQCSLSGTLNGACDGDCVCKRNVEGSRCDKCRDGYFALHKNNPLGIFKLIKKLQWRLMWEYFQNVSFIFICRMLKMLLLWSIWYVCRGRSGCRKDRTCRGLEGNGWNRMIFNIVTN